MHLVEYISKNSKARRFVGIFASKAIADIAITKHYKIISGGKEPSESLIKDRYKIKVVEEDTIYFKRRP